MSAAIKVFSRVLAIGVPVGLGVLTIVFAGDLRKPPSATEMSKPATAVRVVTMKPVKIVPHVNGYGNVTPGREWNAVARVQGVIVETNPKLKNGEVLPAGTVLFRIDDTDLKLSLAQIDSQLAALAVKDRTLNASLGVMRSDLELSRAELARQEKLVGEGAAAETKLDTARRAELAAQAKVVDIENGLALNSAERDVLSTQKAIVARSLEFTTIAAPYDIRIGEVSVGVGQMVNGNQTLMTAEGIDAVEVAAQFSLGRIGPMLRTMGENASVTGLKANVRLPVADHTVVWNGVVDRVGETIDSRTQSTSIVVRIDDPYSQAEAGKRPPLRRNTFVEVILMAPAREALIAPLDAVRDGTALIVDADNTLEKRPVTIGYTMGDVAVVTQGLVAGEKLVVTDPAIAVPGMAVKPVEDKKLLSQLVAMAGGQGMGDGK